MSSEMTFQNINAPLSLSYIVDHDRLVRNNSVVAHVILYNKKIKGNSGQSLPPHKAIREQRTFFVWLQRTFQKDFEMARKRRFTFNAEKKTTGDQLHSWTVVTLLPSLIVLVTQ